MREELQRRIGEAIDSADGITGDAELRAVLAEDADAAAYARDVVRLQSTLRNWPLPEPSDDAFEKLAARIEQRLGDALPRIADPTLAPQFDDDDDLRDATAGLLGPVASSGEFELEESKSVPPPARRIPPPSPMRAAVSSTQPGPKASAALPPPPSAKPAPREMPKLAPASDGDRLSFPSFTPPPLDAPSIGTAKVGDLEKKRRERARFGWIGGLAAAAAVGLGVFAATSTYQGESALSPSSASVTATATGGAMADMEAEESREPAAAPGAAPEPAQDLMAQESPSAPPPYPQGAASVAAPEARRLEPDTGDGFAGARDDSLDGRRLGRARTARPPAALPMRIGGSAPAHAPMADSVASGGGAAPRAERARAAAATSSPAASSADLPAAPERGAVLAAIQAVEPTVRTCAADEHGTATVRIVVAGSGRVTTATVSGQFAGTPVGSCVARAVRTGRFPQFTGDRFEITYPFQL